jgi:hypothetical protein
MSLQEQNILKVLFHKYEDEERQLIAITSYYCGTFIKDGRLRGTYNANITAAVKDLRTKMLFGASNVDDFIKEYKNMHNRPRYSHLHGKTAIQILEETAIVANRSRNAIMETIRMQTSPTMLAWARNIKIKGKEFEELLDKYTKELKYADKFSSIKDETQKANVYMRVFERSGKPSTGVNINMQIASVSCKALIVATYAIAIYNIYNAQDRVSETILQASILSGAYAGGELAGGTASVLCTTTTAAYPICVTVSVFIGAAMGGILGEKIYGWTLSNSGNK